MESYSSYHAGGKGGEFTRLSESIGTNIQKISQNVSSMQKMVNQLGTHQDTDDLRNKLHQIQHYTNQLAKDTSKYLHDLQLLPIPASISEQKQWKMQKERLLREFTDTLRDFQTIQRTATQKEKESVNKARAQSGHSGSFFDGEKTSPQLIELESPIQSQSQMAMQLEEEMNIEMIREREQAIRQLESDILDVNQIFRDLATMVHEQGDLIDSIEAAVDTAQISVEEGTGQLRQASQLQSKVRRKKFILFIILVVVVSIIIGIIVWQTN